MFVWTAWFQLDKAVFSHRCCVQTTLTALLSDASALGALGVTNTNLANALHATPVNAALLTHVKDPIAVPAAGVEFAWGLPKLPLLYSNLVDSYAAHTDAGIRFTFFQVGSSNTAV